MAELANAASSIKTTPDALALAVVLAQTWADVVLSGAASVEEAKSNLTACGIELETQLVDRLLAAIGQDSLSYWQIRAALPWN